MPKLLSQADLSHALAIPDLTDPLIAPEHALQTIVSLAKRALQQHWQCTVQTVRSSPVVPVENNYDRLNYPVDGASRDARYTRYITPRYILRTQTSAAVPDALSGLHGQTPADLLLMLPGIVYRRDSIDRLHSAEPHQLDLWRVVDHKHHRKMSVDDLQGMVATLMTTLLPKHEWRTQPSPHPYTEDGVQIDVYWQDQWVEVGECGLIESSLLNHAGLTVHSGLAMGLGLDRLLMVRKNLPDIRLLRSPQSRVQEQLHDLSPYRNVSMMPAIKRDLSLVVNHRTDVESIGDQVRSLVPNSHVIESLHIVNESAYNELSDAVRRKLGLNAQQKNILLRLVIRDMARTLSSAEANVIRNDVYRLLHEGELIDIALNSADD